MESEDSAAWMMDFESTFTIFTNLRYFKLDFERTLLLFRSSGIEMNRAPSHFFWKKKKEASLIYR